MFWQILIVVVAAAVVFWLRRKKKAQPGGEQPMLNAPDKGEEVSLSAGATEDNNNQPSAGSPLVQ